MTERTRELERKYLEAKEAFIEAYEAEEALKPLRPIPPELQATVFEVDPLDAMFAATEGK